MIKHAFPKDQIFESINNEGEVYDGLSLVTMECLKQRIPKGIRYLSGHLPFGVHTLLEGTAKYITVVRHPVARVSSIFHFTSQFESRYARNGRPISFEEFVEGDDINLDNYQVRVLSGAPELNAPAPKLPSDEVIPAVKVEERHLEQAKRNIEQHFCAAPLDRLTDLGLMLRMVYGWPMWRLFNERKNRTIFKPYIPPDLVQTIWDRNLHDVGLYSWVGERFARLRDEFEPELSRDWRLYNAVNGALTAAGRILPVGLRKRAAEMLFYA